MSSCLFDLVNANNGEIDNYMAPVHAQTVHTGHVTSAGVAHQGTLQPATNRDAVPQGNASTPATQSSNAFDIDTSLLLKEPEAATTNTPSNSQAQPSQASTPGALGPQTPEGTSVNPPKDANAGDEGTPPTDPNAVIKATPGAEDSEDDLEEEEEDGVVVLRKSTKGRHVSSINALHGLVDGVARGRLEWRTSVPPPPFPSMAH